MFRKIINSILFLPLALFINPQNVLAGETKDHIDNVLEEKSDKPFVSYEEIEKIILNNQELKSLQKLVTSASFNLSSKIGQKISVLRFSSKRIATICLRGAI